MTKFRLSFFKVFIVILLVVAFIICVSLLWVYYETGKNKTKDYPMIQKVAEDHADMIVIDDIQHFHGDEAFYIVFGENEAEEGIITFIPYDYNENPQVETIRQSDIIAKETILEKWRENCAHCELVKAIPGLLNDQFIWELTYIDDTDRYVFDYISLHDGKPYEKLRFKKFLK